jgi:hypothetical protein
MAFLFTDKEIIDTLRGDDFRPIYNFVSIFTPANEHPYKAFHFTDFDCDVTVKDISGVERDYLANYLGPIAPPARTGNVTQEIQRLQLKQGLNAGYSNASEDILTMLGKNFHNAKLRIVSYLLGSNGQLKTQEPIMANNGLIKSISRDIKNEALTIEFSNSFGKLDGLKELRTTPGSLKRRYPDDTSFDKANLDIEGHILKWGIS